MAITQNITSIPKAGKRGVDTRDAFVLKQEAFQDALTDTFVTEINNFRTQANGLETNVNNKEASAIQAATTATVKASEAKTSATTATTKASEASTSASIATTKATEASDSAASALVSKNSASDSATIATTKASEASNSASSALSSENIATTKANEASNSAGLAITKATEASNSASVATTKANEASNSAGLALASKNAAKASEINAKTSEINAQQYAEVINPDNYVKINENQTIAGVKTFSSSPIVPTPTTDFQVATKEYVDSTIIDRIGLIEYAYVAKNYHIVAFGGVFNRADYPKLWAYLQSNPSLVKTQAQWQTEATANGGICGFFSDGNGTTTFRVPNLDKAFLRPDSRGAGTYQGDAIRNITGSSDSNVYGFTEAGYVSGAFDVGTKSLKRFSGSPTGIGTGTLLFNASLVVPTAPENRPKNIAVLPLIVAK